MHNSFEIVRAGINTTFQDSGRNNLYHIGIPFGGAMDKRNYVLANSLVGNQINKPVIEFAYQVPLIKYKGNKSSAYILGVELGHLIKSSFSNFDLNIPIPVSKAKRQIRGFNQCELIAEGVSEVLNLPILSDFLRRNNNLISQVNSSRYQRWLNVENQYKTLTQLPKNSKVLIIDDVVTSGATISSCVKAILQKKYPITISVAALAGNKIT